MRRGRRTSRGATASSRGSPWAWWWWRGALRSGSLITARNALDQGREVMAVPGSPMDARAGGCNALIRDGAVLVRDAADIAEALGERGVVARAAPPAVVVPQQAPEASDDSLLDLIGPVPVAADVLIRETGRPAATVSEALLELELAGLVQRHPGGMVSRITR